MGWFSCGYVFTRRPHWDRLRDLTVRHGGIWGYKHRARDVWLAAIPHQAEEGSSPFGTNPPPEFVLDRRTVAPDTRRLLARLDRVADALDTQYLRLSTAWAKLAVVVASRAEVPTFFFAADDEFLDIGCRAEPRRLVEFAGKFPDFLARCRDGLVRLSVPDPGGLSSFPAERLDGLRGGEGVEVVAGKGRRPPPLPSAAGRGPAKGGRQTTADDEELARWGVFYRFPVELWPPEGGDPAEVLGLGTWDLFANFERDFEQEFTCPARMA